MSSKLSASPRTAHTAITRMSSSRCSTFHAHLGSSTVSNAAIKVSSMASLRRKAEPLAGQAAEIEALTSCVTPGVKTVDKLGALRLLGQHLGMFGEKVDLRATVTATPELGALQAMLLRVLDQH